METTEPLETKPLPISSTFSSENSLEGIVSDESDEYHEDDLPDLVIDAHNNASFYDLRRRLSTSSSLDHHLDDDSSSSSVIDLLMSIKPFQKSVSTSNLLMDTLDIDESHEEVHTERSGSKDFRVTYMNHRKSFVIPPTRDVYKSYLSLLPDESSHEEAEEKTKKRQEEIERVLLQFRSLSRGEQNAQRELWKDELNLVEKEIYDLRHKLRDKMKKRTALKRLLGTAKVHEFLLSNFSQVEQKLSDLGEKTSHNIQTAIAVTVKNASAFQRVAKKSVDHLTFEIRELMNQANVQNEAKDDKIPQQLKTCDQNSNSLQTKEKDSLQIELDKPKSSD